MVLTSDFSVFPGFAHLYRLHSGDSRRAFHARLNTKQAPFAVLRGEIEVPLPMEAAWEMGSHTPGDFVWNSSAASVLLSGRVVQALRAHPLSGWNALPVILRGPAGETVSESHCYLQITGRCGAIDDSASTVVEEWMPGGVFPRLKGLYFKADSWDGSDFFTAPGTGFMFVTDAVHRVLAPYCGRNAAFTALDEVRRTPPKPASAARP